MENYSSNIGDATAFVAEHLGKKHSFTMVTSQPLGNDYSMLSTFYYFLDNFLAISWKVSGVCYGSTAAENKLKHVLFNM